MQLLPDRSWMQPPGVCTVCGNTPDEGKPVIDTLVNKTDGLAHENGRKYLCFACVTGAALQLGYITNERLEYAEADARTARFELAVVRERVEALFDTALNSVIVIPDEVIFPVDAAPAEKPAPKARPGVKTLEEAVEDAIEAENDSLFEAIDTLAGEDDAGSAE